MKNYIKTNFSYFLICGIFWIIAAVWGMYIAISSPSADAVGEYIGTIYKTKPHLWDIFINGVNSTIRFSLCIYIASSFVILMPLTLFLTAYKGFAYGFTSGAIIHFYGAKGYLITFLTVLLPLAVSLPVQFTLYASSLKTNIALLTSRYNKKDIKTSEIRINQFKKSSVLCMILCAVALFEAIISKIALAV